MQGSSSSSSPHGYNNNRNNTNNTNNGNINDKNKNDSAGITHKSNVKRPRSDPADQKSTDKKAKYSNSSSSSSSSTIKNSSNTGLEVSKKQKRYEKQTMAVQVPSPAKKTLSLSADQPPRTVNVEEFVQSRAFEIQSMETALSNENQFTGNVRVFQTLPRHMRRRAASYNVKRVPQRVRQRAIEELARTEDLSINLQKDKKRASGSRRVRRSRSTIQVMFGKRSKEGKMWLPTHLWHAKRMHMIQLWGYMLPEHPNDRGTRATYRASLHQSVISDVSYNACLELRGARTDIAALMRSLADPAFPPCERISSGGRQARSFLHHPGKFPFGAIGPFSYFWRPPPSHGSSDLDRIFWIWVHPSMATEAQQAISAAISGSGLSVKLEPLLNEFARFELTGPRSHAILHEVLRAKLSRKISCEMSMNKDDTPSSPEVSTSRAAHVWTTMQHLRTPASLPPGVILSLEVYDPRLSFPPKMTPRKTTEPDSSASSALHDILKSWPQDVSDSELFDASCREALKSSRKTDRSLNRLREQALVPGTQLPIDATSPTIPVLLIQRGGGGCGGVPASDIVSGPASAELVGGWDVILPATYAPDLWKSLIFAGSRAIGLDDRRRLYREAGIASFPEDFPETRAWEMWASRVANIELDKWKRRPKAKRINFEGLNVKSPFLSRFDKVKGFESTDADGILSLGDCGNSNMSGVDSQTCAPVLVFHGPKLIRELGVCMREKGMTLDVLGSRLRDMILQLQKQPFLSSCTSSSSTSTSSIPSPPALNLSQAFVRVRLSMMDGGAPTERAAVYSLSKQQFEHIVKSRQRRREFSSLKGSLVRGRRDHRECLGVLDEKVWAQFISDAALVHDSGFEKSDDHYNGGKGDIADEGYLLDVAHDADRVLGYVTAGGFSLACGRGAALACCTISGLFRGVQDSLSDIGRSLGAVTHGDELGASKAGVDSEFSRLVLVRDLHARRLRPAVWSLLA